MIDEQKILKQLVQIKSYSGQEKKLAGYLVAFAKTHQFDYLKQGKNIVFKFLNHSQKCLIFNGHMDTVNAGNKKNWLYSPYGSKAGVVKNGKLYGLGASDMKAGLAAFLSLAGWLKKQKPKIDVFFAFVVQEETDGSGSQSFVNYFKNKYLKNYQQVVTVIAEPTDNQFIEVGHRGNMFVKLTTFGDSGHASQPQKIKIHAVEEMIGLVGKIKKQALLWSQKYEDEILGQPTFCLTSIKSESVSPNKVPSWCTSVWDIRTTPQIHHQLKKLLQKTLGSQVKIEYLKKPAPYSFISKKEKIVNLFKKIVPGLKIKISPAANDSCFFTQAGIPAITFGPGCKKMAHQVNEYISLKNVTQSIKIYQKLVRNV